VRGGYYVTDPDVLQVANKREAFLNVLRPIIDSRQYVVMDIHKAIELIDQEFLFRKKIEHSDENFLAKIGDSTGKESRYPPKKIKSAPQNYFHWALLAECWIYS
jgi:hypothetical protein